MSALVRTTPQRQPARMLVVVPTTGGPLFLRRLAPRPGLPHPAAFAEGDYRPLALSADYRALAGAEGPVARHLGRPLPPHELRLSGEPDGGRSWEAPVTLAHLLLAGGWALTTDEGEVDLVLWATGAVDLDLRLLPGDYALARKVEVCREFLEGHGGRRTVAVLPPGSGREEAAAALATLRRAVPVQVVLADVAGEALAWLTSEPGPTSAAMSRSLSGRSTQGRWAATASVAVAAWLLSAGGNGPEDAIDTALAAPVEALPDPGRSHDPGPARSDPSDAADAELLPSNDPRGQPPNPEPRLSKPDVEPSTQAAQALETPAADTPVAVIEEVRAAPDANCRAALFDPDLRVLRPVPHDGADYAALALDPLLCGVALRPATAEASLGSVASDPPDAFVAAPSGIGALVLFLSGPLQDVVYAVPVVLGDGSPVMVEHRLVATPVAPTSPTDASTE